jgi:hypothetical protein
MKFLINKIGGKKAPAAQVQAIDDVIPIEPAEKTKRKTKQAQRG